MKEANNKTFIILLSCVVIAAIAVVAFVMLGFPFKGDPPHIILISIDTLRHDHVGYMGHQPEGKSTTPFIDTLSEKGALFSHAVSTSPWTLPGHYSMLTGLPNELHRMVDDRIGYNPKIQTMAQYLKSLGYATGGFFSGPYLDPHFGFNRGFDWYESCMKTESMYDLLDRKRELDKDQRMEIVREKEFMSHVEITSEAVTQKAIQFAKMHKKENLFFFLHYFDVHNDFTPKPPFHKRYDAGYKGWVNGKHVVRDERFKPDMDPKDLHHLKSLYDGEIAWVDHNIKNFFEGLDRVDPSILENSIVVITSDHGEEFFEHGHLGHRDNVYAPCLRIPLLIWWPEGIRKKIVLEDPVRIYDIYPTLLELAGLALPNQIYGRSLKPLMEGKKLEELPIVSELTFIPTGAADTARFDKHIAFQFGKYKLMRKQSRRWSVENPIDFTGEILEEAFRLFDMEEDPEEKNDLFETDPKLAGRILNAFKQEGERMQVFYHDLYGTDPGSDVGIKELNEELLEKIKKVGYMR